MECQCFNAAEYTVLYRGQAAGRLGSAAGRRWSAKHSKWSPLASFLFYPAECFKGSPKFNFKTMIWYINECILMS